MITLILKYVVVVVVVVIVKVDLNSICFLRVVVEDVKSKHTTINTV